jgi:UDP-2-acetamido-3-amino-2,3-dideoxy-glucuronate N-acetyltransferase
MYESDFSVHPMALVETPSEIGLNTTIASFTHIMPHTVIGANCMIGSHVVIASGVLIGNQVRVSHNSLLNSGVVLEDDVALGANTVFTAMKHLRVSHAAISQVVPTLVKRGGFVGPNTTIASGMSIGRFAFVEAGSVVDRVIHDFEVVSGNPVKTIAWRCGCGHVLIEGRDIPSESISCPRCERVYCKGHSRKLMWLEPANAFNSHSGSDPTIPGAQTGI